MHPTSLSLIPSQSPGRRLVVAPKCRTPGIFEWVRHRAGLLFANRFNFPQTFFKLLMTLP
jgi:hypothetical protein